MRGFKDNKDIKKKDLLFSSAFTLVELIVVVVVIAILATIGVVGYNSWRQATATAQLKSDLGGAASAMKNYRNFNTGYPTSVPSTFTPSSGVTLSGGSDDGVTFCISAVNSQFPSLSYHIHSTNSTGAQSGSCISPCLTGFIDVPGSGTYGTADFCVMKYEAKQVGSSTTPISQASGLPWVSIDQPTAIANSPNVAGCTGCHLITEVEWLTIAQNVLTVPSNWSSGTVGTGCIFRGNVSLLDACGYDGADPEFGTGRNAKASLTLTNDEVIWDLAGNVSEWTSGTSTTGQPGVTGDGYNWRQWTAVTNPGTISPNPFPATTGISGANSWNSGNGIGTIYSNTEETRLSGFVRGGAWNYSGHAGVLALFLDHAPNHTHPYLGFRVSR